MWLGIDWTDSGSEDYPGGLVLRDDAGEVLRVSLGTGDVDCRPYYRASPDDLIVKALVAAEDGTFWTHPGVRPLSAVRALFQNLAWRRRVSGASTLTMQAVRLIRPHPKTYWWKVKEAVMAMKMERAKDKCWILSQYLNRAPFGSNLIGIEAASRGWFGKDAKDLGLGEAAMLAGMVQAPSRFRPDRHYDLAFKRRDYVLDRMVKIGSITAEQADAARAVRPVVCRSPRPFKAPYFCDWTLAELARRPEAQCHGGEVATTLNADLQSKAESAVQRAADAGGYSVAAVIVRVADGAVRAMAVSGDYFDTMNGQVNTAVAPRPAGSTLKPLLSALAMDRGLVAPDERLVDMPTAFKGYRPANFDAKHRGVVTLRDALVLSLNIPFVQMLQRMGVPEFCTALGELGFTHLGGDADTFGLGLAIGNAEITLVELARAYATVARGGVAPTGERLLSAESAFLVSDMLSGDERASAAYGHVADVAMSRFAWKTGTSSAYRDAWTVAWNPEYVVAVWCGHKFGGFGDQTLVGAKAAAPVALALARGLYPQNDGPWFVEPGGVGRRPICALTGRPAGASCPKTEEGRYLAGRSSNAPCTVHVRGAQGQVVERQNALLRVFNGDASAAEKLVISRPENGAVFCLVKGVRQQKMVCQVVGNPDGANLWWLVDGVVAGETQGLAPFVAEMTAGKHEVVCTSATGVWSAVTFTIRDAQ